MKRIDVASSADVQEGKIHAATVNGLRIILTRIDGQPRAIENRCAHLGWSMARGALNGTVLRCPWHGSEFDVCTGQALNWVNAFAGVRIPQWARPLVALGKSPASIRTFQATEEAGRVHIAIPE